MTIPVVLLSVIIARLFAPVPVRLISVIPTPMDVTACLQEKNGGACVQCCKEAVGCGPTTFKCSACAHFCNGVPPPPPPDAPAP